jgi:hypothetical protein
VRSAQFDQILVGIYHELDHDAGGNKHNTGDNLQMFELVAGFFNAKKSETRSPEERNLFNRKIFYSFCKKFEFLIIKLKPNENYTCLTQKATKTRRFTILMQESNK